MFVVYFLLPCFELITPLFRLDILGTSWQVQVSHIKGLSSTKTSFKHIGVNALVDIQYIGTTGKFSPLNSPERQVS
jgi:hypothetical protein